MYLQEIKLRKEKELAQLERIPSLKTVLRQEKLTIIAEIKRRSPSKGILGAISDPVGLATQYLEGGASALSVITDYQGFGGTIKDLMDVRAAFPQVPILRKDFIIDPFQLGETVKAGASAVLLIVALLKERTKLFIDLALSLGLDPLVEVLDEEELNIAIDAGAEIIGMNNRDLHTFEVDLKRCEKIAPKFPKGILKIAESGIHTPQDALRMRKSGYDTILVGEAFVKAQNPVELIKAMREV